MKRFFILAALIGFAMSCNTQQSADAEERERKMHIAGEAINAVKEDGKIKLIANEKAVVLDDLKAGKPAPNSLKDGDHEIIPLEVVKAE